MSRESLCVRAFPRAWREVYGAELRALLAQCPDPWRQSLNVVWAGLRERWHRLAVAHELRVAPGRRWMWQLGVASSVVVMLVVAFTIASMNSPFQAAPRGMPAVAPGGHVLRRLAALRANDARRVRRAQRTFDLRGASAAGVGFGESVVAQAAAHAGSPGSAAARALS